MTSGDTWRQPPLHGGGGGYFRFSDKTKHTPIHFKLHTTIQPPTWWLKAASEWFLGWQPPLLGGGSGFFRSRQAATLPYTSLLGFGT